MRQDVMDEMNAPKIKALWNKAESPTGKPVYERSAIERFTLGRSNDTARKIRNLIVFDLVLKTILVPVFVVELMLYRDNADIKMVCAAGILLLLPLVLYEFKILKRFARASDQNQTTREKLSLMLIFLKSPFYTALLAISITYLFFFIGGLLIYFYAAYGYVRPLDTEDVVVFSVLILVGIMFNFRAIAGQVKFHANHLKDCLADLNASALEQLQENIELQRKLDRVSKALLALALIAGFLLLIGVFLGAPPH